MIIRNGCQARKGVPRILNQFQKQICHEGFLAFNNVVIRGVKLSIELPPPKQTLLDREKQIRKGGSNARE